MHRIGRSALVWNFELGNLLTRSISGGIGRYRRQGTLGLHMTLVGLVRVIM